MVHVKVTAVPQLQQFGEGDSIVRCYLCHVDAAGPCMKCRRPVCGDCCVLVEGKAQTWAVCTRCDKHVGDQVSGWTSLGWFFLRLIAALVLIILALAWLAGDLG